MEDNYLPKYSKLKKKELIAVIEKLHQKISVLVNEPDSIEAIIIKHQALYQQDMLSLMWGIDPNKLEHSDKENWQKQFRAN